jgi:predicted dehydrogenase
MRTIRWGILSTGNIANEFAEGLADLPATELVAVGSRSRAAADTFAERWGVPRRHGSYAALAADPEVDVIYIGTPHPFHHRDTLMCLGAGKHVLCEKPFALNVGQAAEMIAAARQRGLFVMEALWTLYLPHLAKVRELLGAGALGEVRMLQADFGFRTPFDPTGRLFDPDLGGGALLDVGIYPLALGQMLFGPAVEVQGFASLGASGVDEEAAVVLRYGRGQLALVATATRLDTPNEAFILGTEGRIRIHPEWWRPGDLTLQRGERVETIAVDTTLPGHNYQALEVNRCLRQGLRASALASPDFTLDLMTTLDRVRSHWGLRYPGE